MAYQILPLARCPEHAEGVAERTYKLWGHLIYEDTGMSLLEFTDVIRARAVEDRVPLTLIALVEDKLIGTVSLKEREDTTAESLSPWIGGLLVDEAWRGKGIGAALLTGAEAAATRLGSPWLHLSCEPEVEHFYVQAGWELMVRTTSCGDEVAVMRKRLA